MSNTQYRGPFCYFVSFANAAILSEQRSNHPVLQKLDQRHRDRVDQSFLDLTIVQEENSEARQVVWLS